MPNSMTAFARVEFSGDWGQGTWELRSVNHRYVEISVRAPEEFRSLESAVRGRVNAASKRGKIDCTLRIDSGEVGFRDITVNQQAAQAVIDAVKKINTLGGLSNPCNALDILRWPGVTQSADVDRELISKAVLTALDEALVNFNESRRREGDKMAEVISNRLDSVNQQLELLRTRVPEIILSIRQRHTTRMLDLAEGLDEGRIEQECALLAQRLDVDEELDRLTAHVSEVARVLEQSEPIGRRLDFLMQELNREANTLGSKSAHIDTAGAAVELKVLIEQMREQVQNIE